MCCKWCWPLEQTCWRQFGVQWGDCKKKSWIAPFSTITIIIIIIALTQRLVDLVVMTYFHLIQWNLRELNSPFSLSCFRLCCSTFHCSFFLVPFFHLTSPFTCFFFITLFNQYYNLKLECDYLYGDCTVTYAHIASVWWASDWKTKKKKKKKRTPSLLHTKPTPWPSEHHGHLPRRGVMLVSTALFSLLAMSTLFEASQGQLKYVDFEYFAPVLPYKLRTADRIGKKSALH